MSLYRTNNVYTCSPQYNEYLEEIQNKCYSVIAQYNDYRTNNVYTCRPSPQYNEYLEEIQNKCYSVIAQYND